MDNNCVDAKVEKRKRQVEDLVTKLHKKLKISDSEESRPNFSEGSNFLINEMSNTTFSPESSSSALILYDGPIRQPSPNNDVIVHEFFKKFNDEIKVPMKPLRIGPKGLRDIGLSELNLLESPEEELENAKLEDEESSDSEFLMEVD